MNTPRTTSTRHRFTSRIVIAGLGSSVTLSAVPGDHGLAADKALWAQLADIWQRCLGRPVIDHHSSIRLKLGSPEPGVYSHPDQATLLQGLTQLVTRALIGHSISRMLLLHAAGLSHPTTGASLAFIARGGTGKSTLTTTLGREFGYLSDETVAVLPDGGILPYPKPVSLRTDTPTKRETGPDELRLLPCPASPHLSGLVLLNRDPQATGLQVEPLELFDAITAILPETSSLSRQPRALHVLADLIERTGGVQRWTYSEHDQLIPLARERLEA